jgi:hypothetical protein
MNTDDRYTRQEALFGAAGQRLLSGTRVGILGVGGLGSIVAMELGYAGIGRFVLIDPDRVSVSNLNRLVGSIADDADLHSTKTSVTARMLGAIAPASEVSTVTEPFDHPDAAASLGDVDVVMVCVDQDAVRLEASRFLTELAIPYFDLASDTGSTAGGAWYGGRVLFSGEGERCPVCMDLLDQHALARARMTASQRMEEGKIYGVEQNALTTSGPSVISINAVVASLAVGELIKWRTGLGTPAGLLTYRGDLGVVMRAAQEYVDDCFYCEGWGSTRRARRIAVG